MAGVRGGASEGKGKGGAPPNNVVIHNSWIQDPQGDGKKVVTFEDTEQEAREKGLSSTHAEQLDRIPWSSAEMPKRQ